MVERKESAVIDRIVDGKHAVLLVGENERELIIPSHQLPEEATEGTWLTLSYKNSDLVSIAMDMDKTIDTRKRIEENIEKLKQRRKSNFKK